MRRISIAALMISLALLPGCGRGARDSESFEKFREALLLAESISFRAEMRADYGDTAADYALDCVYSAGEYVMTLRSPELISGVVARAEEGELELEYDGAVLAAGELSEDGLDPVSFLPAMLDALRGGHLLKLWREGDELAAQLILTESSDLTLWLDAGSMKPRRAEAVSGGRVVIFCGIRDFSAA